VRSNWVETTLGDVLTERRETPAEHDLMLGKIRVIAKIGFSEGQIEFRNDTKTKTKMILASPGDLVLSGINAAKGAIAVYGEENTHPIAATIHYSAYIPNKEKVDVKFLWWLLRSERFRDTLLEYVPGGIKTELKASRFLPLPILIPELNEQRRIVGRIEVLAGKVEQARRLRETAVAQTNALLASYISKFLNQFPLNGKLGNILKEKPRNGWSPRCDNAEDGTPVLTLSAVTGFQYDETAFKRTSLSTFPDKHYWLQKDDLLMTRSNTLELVGHAAIYNGNPSPCIYSDLMMRVPVDESVASKKFVHWWLQSAPVRDSIMRSAKGTSPTMKKISQKTVIDIPFPENISLNKQKEVVNQLDQLHSKIAELHHHQTKAQAEINALLPAILDKAFQGEL